MSTAVRAMFSSIAKRYDRANAVLSLGIHGSWRRSALRLLDPRPGERFLDVCCGTGDVALALAAAVGPGGRVVGADFCDPMLRLARAKLAADRAAPVALLGADALRLPFANATFDGVTVAFGVRNLDDLDAGLRELRRVVRPGGRVVVLEFGQPTAPVFAPVYRCYSSAILPRVGGWLTGERAPYEYLPRTAAAFPAGEAFLERLGRAGLTGARAVRLTLGIAYAYRGDVPHPELDRPAANLGRPT